MNDDYEQLYNIKTQLLVWAGLHRGERISEAVMPRFHEIIDQLDEIIQRMMPGTSTQEPLRSKKYTHPSDDSPTKE